MIEVYHQTSYFMGWNIQLSTEMLLPQQQQQYNTLYERPLNGFEKGLLNFFVAVLDHQTDGVGVDISEWKSGGGIA